MVAVARSREMTKCATGRMKFLSQAFTQKNSIVTPQLKENSKPNESRLSRLLVWSEAAHARISQSSSVTPI